MSITVGCKCGWEGDQDLLLHGPKDQDSRYCPNCARLFAKYPRPAEVIVRELRSSWDKA